jgi:ribosome maturation factor RimP
MAGNTQGKRSKDDNRLDLNQLAASVIALLEPELSAGGFELVDVRIFRGGGRHQLRIYVDAPDGGINIDQVTAASRTASMLLEEADLIIGQYVIEVSSPGIRRPLRTLDHFRAVVGEKVDLKVAMKDLHRVRGVLKGLEESTLVVEIPPASDEEEAVTLRVELGSVLEGNLDPDFDAQALINADRRKKREDKRQERRAKRGPKMMRPKAPKKTGSE